MSNLSLFEPDPSPAARELGEKLRNLASQGVWIGASSWKYEGWLGQVYSEERYLSRGRLSKRKFKDNCLAEYAETFPIVCGDFTFYQFPSVDHWRKLFHSAPANFQYAFKVPEDITVKVFPKHARYSGRAGMRNDSFLNADLFQEAFLRPLESYRSQVAVLIFEFGAFSKSAYATPAEFAADLDVFLSALPAHCRYSVEIRNPEFLALEYFAALGRHNVAHTFNAWARMPELSSQIALRDAFTADFTVTRALLKHGRGYENAVGLFQPYDRIQEPNPRGREALRELVKQARTTGQPAFIFVNNRFEGNAPGTIAAVVED